MSSLRAAADYAASIAAALGGAYRSGAWWRCRCPVHGGMSATLALRDGARGLIVRCFAGCTSARILAELHRRGLYIGEMGEARAPDPEAERRRSEAEAAERRRRIALARDMWRSALPAEETIVARYLCHRLPRLAAIPPAIRYLPPGSPYARHPEGAGWPVMLAGVQRIGEPGIVAVTRTWIAMDGRAKASLRPLRKFTGPVAGGAVRLAPAGATLIVAEGVETTLAAMTAASLSGWAALSAGGIERLILPPIVRTVIIAADHDSNGIGERAARIAERKWLAEGRRVRIFMSPRAGEDAADLLAAQAQDAWVDAAMGARHAA